VTPESCRSVLWLDRVHGSSSVRGCWPCGPWLMTTRPAGMAALTKSFPSERGKAGVGFGRTGRNCCTDVGIRPGEGLVVFGMLTRVLGPAIG